MTETSPIREFVFVALGWLIRTAQVIFHMILQKVQGSKKGMIPPIRNSLLLEPAVVLAEKIRTKKVRSEDVVQAYIDRIQDVDPLLNAVVEDRYSDALDEARKVDKYIQSCGKSPAQLEKETPLLGVPFTTKEAMPVKGLAVATGVVARKGMKADEDCLVVANMRKAGAIPLCVTNVCQLCFWIDGSNRLYGTTNNAYDLTRTPGGSSGGEGALLSAAASVIGLGSDIGGSIRVPCAFSGIFGHKTTRMVSPNDGMFPATVGSELDLFYSNGPMCRYASDLLLMLKVMTGHNASKMKLDSKVNLKDVKVYYTEDYITQNWCVRVDPEIRKAVRKTVEGLETTYGMKVQKVTIPHLNKAWDIWLTKIGSVEINPTLEDLATNGNGKSFNMGNEVLKACVQASDHTLHFLYLLYLCNLHKRDSFEEVNKVNHGLCDEINKVFNDMLGNDGVFIFPTNPNTAMYHNEQLIKFANFAYTGLFNFLGNPVTQCPVGLSSEGLPLGLQVVGNHHNDHLTIAVGREIEKLFGGWVPSSAIIVK